MKNFRNTTDELYDTDIKSSEVVIVDVWAEWCGPCKMIMPLLEQVAEMAPALTIVKLNADSTEKMGELGVRGVPTLLKYKNGELVDRRVGSLTLAQLKEFAEV